MISKGNERRTRGLVSARNKPLSGLEDGGGRGWEILVMNGAFTHDEEEVLKGRKATCMKPCQQQDCKLQCKA